MDAGHEAGTTRDTDMDSEEPAGSGELGGAYAYSEFRKSAMKLLASNGSGVNLRTSAQVQPRGAHLADGASGLPRALWDGGSAAEMAWGPPDGFYTVTSTRAEAPSTADPLTLEG